jgi:hypothetical protein
MLLAACSGNSSNTNTVKNADSGAALRAEAKPSGEPVLIGSFEGLSVAGTSVAFGAPLTAAVRMAEAAGGASQPPVQLEECSAGPLVSRSVGNLSLFGDGEQFVGWHLSEGDPPRLRTDGGVTIGSPVRELGTAHRVEIFESSVGTEFHVTGGLGGLLSDASPNARVTHLWAGTTCIMR